jgi:hypothetical protein
MSIGKREQIDFSALNVRSWPKAALEERQNRPFSTGHNSQPSAKAYLWPQDESLNLSRKAGFTQFPSINTPTSATPSPTETPCNPYLIEKSPTPL